MSQKVFQTLEEIVVFTFQVGEPVEKQKKIMLSSK